jgi:hypothetical protein
MVTCAGASNTSRRAADAMFRSSSFNIHPLVQAGLVLSAEALEQRRLVVAVRQEAFWSVVSTRARPGHAARAEGSDGWRKFRHSASSSPRTPQSGGIAVTTSVKAAPLGTRTAQRGRSKPTTRAPSAEKNCAGFAQTPVRGDAPECANAHAPTLRRVASDEFRNVVRTMMRWPAVTVPRGWS